MLSPRDIPYTLTSLRISVCLASKIISKNGQTTKTDPEKEILKDVL